jgi:hypothetical protein
MEKHLLKVLKGLAELKNMSLGDLEEGIVLHAFEGEVPFSPKTLKEIQQLGKIYGLTLKASDSYRLEEKHTKKLAHFTNVTFNATGSPDFSDGTAEGPYFLHGNYSRI